MTVPTPDEWSTLANIATSVGTVVALGAVIVTLIVNLRSERLTRQGQDLEREQAEATAARSEAAAALTEEYTRRVVLALEAMAAGGVATGASGSPPRVRWALKHHGGDTYVLENIGDVEAKNVIISAHETLRLINLPDKPQDLRPGEAIDFMAAVSLGTKDMTIKVQWQDAATAEFLDWKYPLPPRPSRR